MSKKLTSLIMKHTCDDENLTPQEDALEDNDFYLSYVEKTFPNRFLTDSDMGCIKIYNDGLSCFFDNEIGDICNRVDISFFSGFGRGKFKGHFTVRKEAYLSNYDCLDTPIFTFPKGRYFIYLVEPGHFLIVKEDEELES